MPRSFNLPVRSSVPLGEFWMNSVSNSPIVWEKLPLEVALSYPVPGRGVVSFFHYRTRQSDGAMLFVSRITAALPDITIIDFLTPEYGPLFAELPETVVPESGSFDRETHEALLESYASLVARFPTRPAGTLGTQWLGALEELVSAPLIPYYESLNPEFFAWCRGKSV